MVVITPKTKKEITKTSNTYTYLTLLSIISINQWLVHILNNYFIKLIKHGNVSPQNSHTILCHVLCYKVETWLELGILDTSKTFLTKMVVDKTSEEISDGFGFWWIIGCFGSDRVKNIKFRILFSKIFREVR